MPYTASEFSLLFRPPSLTLSDADIVRFYRGATNFAEFLNAYKRDNPEDEIGERETDWLNRLFTEWQE